jgi:hypothetical protein
MKILLNKLTTDQNLEIGLKVCYQDINGEYTKLGKITDIIEPAPEKGRPSKEYILNTAMGSYTADELKLIQPELIKNTVYLRDHKEAVKEECLKRNGNLNNYYSAEEIDNAIEAHVKRELRYKPTEGRTYNNILGWISEYTKNSDIPEYTDPAEAAKDQFSGEIRNSASRVKRGYDY